MSPLRLGLGFLVLPLLLFLPGYLLLRLLRGRQEVCSGLADQIFVSILASTLLVSAVAFPLAEMGVFSLPLLLGLVAGLVTLLAVLIWRRRSGLVLPRPAWPDLLPLLAALLGAAIAFRPYEYILGSGDAGGYINIGVTIAKTGGIILYNHDVAALDPQVAQQELLFPDTAMPGMEPRYHHIPSFLISDLERGQITPQFYHLFPTWIAIGYTLFGLRGSLYVTPMFGVLAILAVYFAGKTIFGRWAGLLGSLFLGLNVVQMWFMRYPTSEIITQYFLFATVYLLALWLEPAPSASGERWQAGSGVLVAGTLGALLHIRVDSLLALLPIVLWVLYMVLFRRDSLRARWPFFLALGLVLAHFLLYFFTIGRRYTLGSILGLYYYLLRPGMALALAGLGIGGSLAVAFLARRGWLKSHERLVRSVVITLLAALAIWAYFIWPAITPPQTVTYPTWPEPTPLTFENDENLVRLGWYMTPWGLLLGTLGLLEAIRREPASRITYLLAVFLLYGVIYTYQVGDSPMHINMMRRYVPEAIPTLALGAGYALQRLGQVVRGKAGLALASALGLGLLVLTVLPTWPLLGHVEYAGAIDRVTELAGRFDERAVLLYTDVQMGTLLGMPLNYIFQRPGFVLLRERPDPAALSAQVQAWDDQGKEVYLLVGDGRSRLSPSDFSFEFQETVSFSLPLLEQTLDRRPARVVELPFFLEIYRLGPGAGIAASGERFIDVGTADYLFIGGGFWGKERAPDGLTFRWTQADAELLLPGSWFAATGPLSLTMALGNTRPPEVPPARLEVWLEDEALASFTVQPGLQPYSIVVPQEVARTWAGQKEVRLRLHCNAWRPSTIGIPDERELGVFVDWVRLDAAFD